MNVNAGTNDGSAGINAGGAGGTFRRYAGWLAARRACLHRAACAASTALAATVLASTALAMTAALAPAAPASADVGHARGRTPAGVLRLGAMPAGSVAFGRDHQRRLTLGVAMFGLTPGSAHRVDLRVPGRRLAIRFGVLTANSVGQAAAALHSTFTGSWRPGSRLLIRMGLTGRIGLPPIAETGRLTAPGKRPHRLIAVEVSPSGTSYGTPAGLASISYNASLQTLTVTVHAAGITPGPHAAHIHLGSCSSQGPVKYALGDLVADKAGVIVHAVRVFTHVTTPIPAHGWYLNIHQGNSGDITHNGQPTIFFRPLLCANITAPAAAAAPAR